MKSLFTFFAICIATLAAAQDTTKTLELTPENTDSTEYELIISETGFQSWFVTNRKPKWYHSHEYYRSQNELYTQAWNSRVSNPAYYEPYDFMINYDLKTDYGIDLDYKLYWYFQFMEHKYNLNLINSNRPK